MTTGSSSEHPTVEEVAHEAVGWLTTGPDVARDELGDVVVLDRPLPNRWFAAATRVQFGDAGSDEGIARVRSWFASRGRRQFEWWLGPAHTPSDLALRLVSTGAALDPDGLTAMVLDREPPAGPPDIDVRRVTSYEEYLVHDEIVAEAFHFSADEIEAARAASRHAWKHWSSEPDRLFLLAWRNGRPIAEGTLAGTRVGPMLLSGGATRLDSRGHGAYRALVRARWDEAVRRGAGALVVQASPMSRPILERAGFRAVGEVTVLADPSSGSGA